MTIALASLAPLAACSGKNGTGTGGQGGACAEQATAVRQIYAAEANAKASTDNDEGAALAADLLEANVHMILTDCETDPGTFVPCIGRSKSVADLERDCIQPLDDEGRVEGRQFGAK